MADPKRLLILKALTARLETVTVANGYQHELAGKVFRGRALFDDEDPLPCVSILESPSADREPTRVGYSRQLQKETWVLLIQGWAVDDPVHPGDPAHLLMADCKKALAQIADDDHVDQSWYMLGGLIAGLLIEPGVVRPPADNPSSRAFFYLRVDLELWESLINPYATDNR